MKAFLLILAGVAGLTAGVYFANQAGFGGMDDVPEGTPPIIVAFHDQLTASGIDTVVRPVKNKSSHVQRQYSFEQKDDDDRFYVMIAATPDGAAAQVKSLQAVEPIANSAAKDKLVLRLIDVPESGNAKDQQVRDFFSTFKFNAGVEDPHKARVVY